MQREGIERTIRAAGAILVDPRLVRRVIQAHRDLVGLGLAVPHTHCYAIDRKTLLATVPSAELGAAADDLPDPVVLIARPPPAELARLRPHEQLARLWRLIFHAQVHIALGRRIADGLLPASEVRKRIAAIGQVEFEEVRRVLHSDELLLPPGDEREQYVEFAALYLELRHFAPDLIATTFPALGEDTDVDAIIAEDVDGLALLDRSCPDGAEPAGTVVREPPRSTRATTLPRSAAAAPKRSGPLGRVRARRWVKAAEAAKSQGNDVRAALLRAAAAAVLGSSGEPPVSQAPTDPGRDRDEEAARGLAAAARADLRDLSGRLNRALSLRSGVDPEAASVQWGSLLWILVDEAVRSRRLRYSVEARLLYDLQLAVVASEREQSAVDLVTWALSRGGQPIVRALPATREVRIARHIHVASHKVRHTRLESPDRKLLAKMMRWAAERADRNVRSALRPALSNVLDEVGIRHRDVVERIARDKLVEELLDRIVERGFVSYMHLRDAISRNQLKLDDMASARELWTGDALLAADKRLARSLDGVYRPGEIYLRGLQRLSALPFSNRIGRVLLLYLLFPLGLAFIALEGLGHLVVSPVAKLVGATAPAMLNWISFSATAVVILGLIHLRTMRTVAWELLSVLGWLLATLLLRIPRWVLGREPVRKVLRRGLVRVVFRRLLAPLAVTGLVLLFVPIGKLPVEALVGGTVALFALLSLAMTARVGEFVEGLLFDWLAPRWHTLSSRVLPGLVRFIVELFQRLMDRLERGLYRVDELLRFRGGQSALLVPVKAVLGLGWFFVAYITRLYVTLLVEPELNPVKHFPIATIAHKLTIGWVPEMLAAMQIVFSPFGTLIGGTLAVVTTTILPSSSAFFAWELKENWKLYRSSRAKSLEPTRVGVHGETIAQLMIPGVHSGTLPKLYERLRRAAQREDEAARASGEPGPRRPTAEGARGRFREGIEEIETAVRRFVERDFVALLTQSPLWTFGPVTVSAVHLVPSRIRVELCCEALGPAPTEIAFEDKQGHVIASIAEPGFVAALLRRPEGAWPAVLFENALAGLYHLAGVDLVREQLRFALGGSPHYDITDKHLVVWPDRDYRTEIRYLLRGGWLGWQRPMARPHVTGAPPETPPPPIDRRELLFGDQVLGWDKWVEVWSTDDHSRVERLVVGPSLLPPLEEGGLRDAMADAGTPTPPPASAVHSAAAYAPTELAARAAGAGAPSASLPSPTLLSPASDSAATSPQAQGPSGTSGSSSSSAPEDAADPLGRSAQQRTPVE